MPIPSRFTISAIGNRDTATRADEEISTLEYIMDASNPLRELLSDAQLESLRTLRMSLLRGDRRHASVPDSLWNMPKNNDRDFLIREYSGVATTPQKKWSSLRNLYKAKGVVSYLKKATREPKNEIFQAPKEWEQLPSQNKDRLREVLSWSSLSSPEKKWNSLRKFYKAKGVVSYLKRASRESQNEIFQAPKEWEQLPSQNKDRLREVLSWSSLSKWDFDVFEVDEITNGKPLLFIGWAIMASPSSQEAMGIQDSIDKNNIDGSGYDFSELGLSIEKLINFLRTIEEKYTRENPYHNNTHGADVLQTFHTLLQMGGLEFVDSKLETFAMLIAAAIHDVGHPGRSNAFQINAKTDVALYYNDKSVLENMHASLAFRLLLGSKKQEELNFLDFCKEEELKKVRSMIIEGVLHTDMSQHFINISKVKGMCVDIDEAEEVSKENKEMALYYFLHMADISGQAKPHPLFINWTERITEELYAQGDEEKSLELPVSPLCDRDNHNVSKSQLSFVNYIVKPAFDLMGEFIPLVRDEVMPVLEDNLNYWKTEVNATEE
eukprot:CAMPEP_0172521502 /NCGR_PEP_ID=MMETSP1066-20121228/292615_1 /TAXON_ID=671091 /ORGANISM="Coscinodiscus wailesii, Strain CCMP2513" /LENGTH=549 /DNA_ID=CAMNT_0013304421 /DNA_START=67 /DNA_END=1716 /DNA_ORIENTATION=+